MIVLGVAQFQRTPELRQRILVWRDEGAACFPEHPWIAVAPVPGRLVDCKTYVDERRAVLPPAAASTSARTLIPDASASATPATLSLASLTAFEILTDVRGRSPYERTRVDELYRGIPVDWTGEYQSLHLDSDQKTATVFIDCAPEQPVGLVEASIALDDYPQLKVLLQKCPVRICGRIKSVSDRYVSLMDVTLHFPE